MSQLPIVICHGGAAPLEEARQCGKMCGIKDAARVGYRVLARGATALDAVEAAIKSMEVDQFFNAGYGCVLTNDGLPELEASIMDGKDLSVGSAALLSVVKNPITLARKIKEKSPFKMLCGEGAIIFAKKYGVSVVSPESLISGYSKKALQDFKDRLPVIQPFDFGESVGCVAMDKDGNIAAGTSTGGTTGKVKGRVGDGGIIGCGTYADNKLGGVACTGPGETLIRVVMAHTICVRLGSDPKGTNACRYGVQKVHEIKGKNVGAIAISKDGSVGVHFNAPMMPWCYIKDEKLHFGLKPGQDFSKGLNEK